ncbi:MAG: hypothetical protein HZB46_16195 [Solirubrobacterales bacterium]|nr:hypothetical protein [Solirubrobacterales bacterium]
MPRFDDLPADQKAVLQLVLRQGRTYEEIAGLLRISPEAVRDRALNALDALGPDDAAGLPDEREDEIGDYLLSQQTASRRAATREYLEGSPDARAWARAVSNELRELAGDDLPEIPAEQAEVDEAFDALEARKAARVEREKSSRIGGVLLLAGLVLAIVAGVLALTGAFDGGDDNGDKAASTSTAQTQTATGGQTQVDAQINLTPPDQGSKALGVANIVRQDNQRAIAVIGQDLPASPRYVLWLVNGSNAKFLGFFPPVTGKGQAKGRLQGLVAAPDDIGNYKQLVVSRETNDKPSKPTTIVLRGTLGQ